MSNRTLELWVGLFVAAGMAALFMLAMQVSNLSNIGGDDGYRLTASFENIGGLKVRSPVTVAGVRVGRVEAIDYDFGSFSAVVTMTIDDHYRGFPEDTSASIFTAGLLGEQYIALEPGGAMDNLGDGGRILLTQSALVMEQIIGQFLYSMASGGKSEDQPSADSKPEDQPSADSKPEDQPSADSKPEDHPSGDSEPEDTPSGEQQ